MSTERIQTSRHIPAAAAEVFEVLRSPAGHVAIDSSGMLQSADGDPVQAVGDSFVVHMDREALGDLPMGRYDVTVIITRFEPAAAIEWKTSGVIQPPIGHRYGYLLEPDGDGTRVTSYCDWSQIDDRYRDRISFPIVAESSLRATLGILARTVAAG